MLAVVSWRGILILRRELALNAVPSGTPHGPDVYWRLNRAHVNAVENLPIFGAVVVAGVLLGVSHPWFSTLAWTVLAGRLAQSIFHVSGSSELVVSLRFSALFVQLAAIAGMVVLIFSHQG